MTTWRGCDVWACACVCCRAVRMVVGSVRAGAGMGHPSRHTPSSCVCAQQLPALGDIEQLLGRTVLGLSARTHAEPEAIKTPLGARRGTRRRRNGQTAACRCVCVCVCVCVVVR
jgi:hypothetical protein